MNEKLQDLLISAVITNSTEEIEYLLKQGADPNAVDNNGDTALILAAGKGHPEAVKILLEKGADPNAAGNDGQTALKLAVRRDYPETAIILLKKGADHNIADRDGNTIMMYAMDQWPRYTPMGTTLWEAEYRYEAAKPSYAEIIKISLEKGADPYVENREGGSLVKIATNEIKQSIPKVEQYLGKSGNQEVTIRDFLNQKNPKKLVDYMGNNKIIDNLSLLIKKYQHLNSYPFLVWKYAEAKQQKFYDDKIRSIDFFRLPGEITRKIGYYLINKQDKLSLLVACAKKAMIVQDCSTFPESDASLVDSGPQAVGSIDGSSQGALLQPN